MVKAVCSWHRGAGPTIAKLSAATFYSRSSASGATLASGRWEPFEREDGVFVYRRHHRRRGQNASY